MQTFWYRRLLLKDSKMLQSLEAEVGSDPSIQVTLARIPPLPLLWLPCQRRS
jgi:hypothetical protein